MWLAATLLDSAGLGHVALASVQYSFPPSWTQALIMKEGGYLSESSDTQQRHEGILD